MSRCIFGDLATATQMRGGRDFFYRCQTDSWDCWPSEYPFRRSAISAELIPSDFTWSVCHISRPLLFVDVTTANLHFDLDNSAAAACSCRGRISVTHKIIFYRNTEKNLNIYQTLLFYYLTTYATVSCDTSVGFNICVTHPWACWS